MSQLHPIHEPDNPEADVIFVHGLGGDPLATWWHDDDQPRDSWPFWLADEFPNVAIHTLEYEASPSRWLGRGMPLVERGKQVLAVLGTRGIGERPIVFICHSLGGLVVKQLLREAQDKAVAKWQAIADRTEAVVFLATPHAGSDLATWLDRLSIVLRDTPVTEDLTADNRHLLNLNEWYRANADRLGIATHCFKEAYPTKGAFVVEPSSADPGITGVEALPVDADHLTICKPDNRQDWRCLYLADVIRAVGEREPQPDETEVAFIDPLPMPADLDDFQARTEQVTALLDTLRGSGQVAITAIGGMGGIGKTALAVHVARRLDERGETPDGQRYLDLQGVSAEPLAPAEAIGKLIQSFDPTARPPAEAESAALVLRQMLDGRRVLLLLDNAKGGDQIRWLLDGRTRVPSAKILVTSRQTVTGDGLASVQLDLMAPDEARAFLRKLLKDRTTTDDELDRLAARCGHLPLALRVAGRFLQSPSTWSIEEYLEALASAEIELKLEGDPNKDVKAVLGLSAQRLADEDRSLAQRWQTLVVFPTDFDRVAVARVWDCTERDARNGLDDLVGRSMLGFDDASCRYRLHDLMREVARLPLEGEDDALLARHLETAAELHARHYCGVLGEADRLYLAGGDNVLAALRLYDLEQRNIAAAQAWTVAQMQASDDAARLAANFANAGVYVLHLRLTPRERVDWLEAQRDACKELGDSKGESYALGNLGNVYRNLGESGRAIEHYEQVLAIARERSDRVSEGNALGSLGNAYRELGKSRRAIEHYERVLAIARERGDRRTEGVSLTNLGNAYADLDEPRRAIEEYEQASAAICEIGDRRAESLMLYNWAGELAKLGETEEALAKAEAALAIDEEIEDPTVDQTRALVARLRAS